mmetsp:Transcript_50601/g.113708  ORF Transcript_50601/g.113708 Transcript_50601/m.113708 type:complete len:259 (+) Transcript_50601:611-1387(+)
MQLILIILRLGIGCDARVFRSGAKQQLIHSFDDRCQPLQQVGAGALGRQFWLLAPLHLFHVLVSRHLFLGIVGVIELHAARDHPREAQEADDTPILHELSLALVQVEVHLCGQDDKTEEHNGPDRARADDEEDKCHRGAPLVLVLDAQVADADRRHRALLTRCFAWGEGWVPRVCGWIERDVLFSAEQTANLRVELADVSGDVSLWWPLATVFAVRSVFAVFKRGAWPTVVAGAIVREPAEVQASHPRGKNFSWQIRR